MEEYRKVNVCYIGATILPALIQITYGLELRGTITAMQRQKEEITTEKHIALLNSPTSTFSTFDLCGPK